jgi:hypothetical protein
MKIIGPSDGDHPPHKLRPYLYVRYLLLSAQNRTGRFPPNPAVPNCSKLGFKRLFFGVTTVLLWYIRVTDMNMANSMMAMCSPTRHDNIEPFARAICGRELSSMPDTTAATLPALVERFWPVIAAELVAGLRNDDGDPVLHPVSAGLAAWEDWLDSQ